MSIMIMNLSLMISIMFIMLNHPMTMGMTLLIQTILISLITGFLNNNFWFSYILFLIMVGGLLVLFIYMTSIASNEMFNYSLKMIIFIIIIMMLMNFIMMMMYDNYFYMMNLIFNENFFNKNYLTLPKFFNYPSVMIIFLMINYLFITLIAIVKITKIEIGPLRQKF